VIYLKYLGVGRVDSASYPELYFGLCADFMAAASWVQRKWHETAQHKDTGQNARVTVARAFCPEPCDAASRIIRQPLRFPGRPWSLFTTQGRKDPGGAICLRPSPLRSGSESPKSMNRGPWEADFSTHWLHMDNGGSASAAPWANRAARMRGAPGFAANALGLPGGRLVRRQANFLDSGLHGGGGFY
jgi:hypothetical protein